MEQYSIISGILLNINNTKWRVIYTSSSLIRIINAESNKTEVKTIPRDELMTILQENTIEIIEEEPLVIDITQLTSKQKDRYIKAKTLVTEFFSSFGPSFLELEGRSKDMKNFVDFYSSEMQLSAPTIYKIIRQWLQSGLQDYALVYFRNSSTDSESNTGYKKKYNSKPGRKSDDGKQLTDDDFAIFKTMLEIYKKNPKIFRKSLYNQMILYFYMGDNIAKPTQRQLDYYIDNAMDTKSKMIRKTSAKEYRNNERLLKDTPRRKDIRPGDIIEVDAWESDIYIISEFQQAQIIGKPIVYFMVDVCTKAIVSYYVGLENNSKLGIASTLLNLIDQNISEPTEGIIQVSGILPKVLRCDRGAEYKSHYLVRVCKELQIDLQLAPGAMGSYKGSVEHSFSELHNSFRAFLLNLGVIEPTYSSNHKKEACLTLSQYRDYIETYVATQNKRYIKNLIIPAGMLKEGYSKTPEDIWKYKIAHNGGPRIISSAYKKQAIYTLLYEGTATISREGIIFNKLYYRVEDDDELEERMQRATINANRKDSSGKLLNSMDIRFDPMNINSIYYLKDNHIKELSLHPRKNGELKNISWSQYNDYLMVVKKLDKEGAIINQNIEFTRMNKITSIKTEIDNSNRFIPSYNNVASSRKRDKEIDNYQHSMSSHMSGENVSFKEVEDLNAIVTQYEECDAEQISTSSTNTEKLNGNTDLTNQEAKTKRITIEDLKNLYKKKDNS